MRQALFLILCLALLPGCSKNDLVGLSEEEYQAIYSLPSEEALAAMSDDQIAQEITDLQNRMERLTRVLSNADDLEDDDQDLYRQMIRDTDTQISAYRAEQLRRTGDGGLPGGRRRREVRYHGDPGHRRKWPGP